MKEMPKAYEPGLYEDEIAKKERESGYYNPDNLPGEREEMFSMVLPPPNATGILHMGHAVMLAVQDIMVRFARMRGKKTLWLPGTDHAAIATQVKVEKLLKKNEGKSRHDLGREKFLKKVDEFVNDSRSTIKGQVKKMGSSVDWSREAFTLDEERNLAVRTMFKKMYDDGLLYRGERVVNWDPVGQTVVSDDELVYKEGTAQLYTFKYSKDFPISIATTRPETKVGDTAVAVHPDDDRYKDMVGKTFEVEFAGARLNLKVIADREVDPEFGTGALGVTPAHSMVDYEMAQKNDLELVQVIGEDQKMTEAAGSLVAGVDVLEAREKVVEWLRENDLLEAEEEVPQNISTADRTGAVIEPLPKLQWFIDTTKEFELKRSDRARITGLKDGSKVTMKQLMKHVVETRQVTMIPEMFEKVYMHWVDNLRPWCISRQLWYGHEVPAWYRGDEVYVGIEPPHGEGWEKDPDVLDTWFSSGMWTFSTMGWPDEEARDLVEYHPTTMLETAPDILPFWVSRMILMSTYALGEIPFRFVYFHGLVRDELGRKMSKSLDNNINPLDMIEKYGTDATRLSLVIGATPGKDSRLSEEKIAGFRNFTNKLWNIGRFVLTSVSEVKIVEAPPVAQTEADAWIIKRLNETIARVTELLDEPKFMLSQAGEVLREFTWGDFADWYVEVAKVQMKDPQLKASTEAILLDTLECIIKMWHPFMPFVTTKLWEEFGSDKMLLIEDWPEVLETTGGEKFDRIKDIVVAIRQVRATYKIDPARKVDAVIVSKEDWIEPMSEVIRTLARVEKLEVVSSAEKPDGAASTVAGGATIYVPLAGIVDIDAEKARMKKELEEIKKYVEVLDKKLSNEGFVNNAPKEAVDKENQKRIEATAKLEALKVQLGALE